MSTDEPAPLSDLPQLQKDRLEYAWNWFNFHAEQRTKMFNYMLLGLGILATAIATTLQRGQALAAIGLSIAAVLLCVAFGRMDRRNRDLYRLAQDALSGIEEKYLFTTAEKGLAKEVTRENTELKKALWRVLWNGHHRFWMPSVMWIFGIVFAAALALACDMHRRPDAYPSPDKTIVVCCRDGTSPPQVPPGEDDPGIKFHTSTPTDVPLAGTGTISSGWRWLAIVGGLLIISAGVALFVSGKSRLAGGALVASGIAAAAIPNLSIPLHAELHVDPSVEFKLPVDVEVTINKLLRDSQPMLLESRSFGGFDKGDDGTRIPICGMQGNAESAEKIRSALSRAQTQGLQPLVVLVGSTDRTPLSPAGRARFESNTGLARARVGTVESCLKLNKTSSDGNGPQPEIVRVVSGPSHTTETRDPPEVEKQELGADRKVDVFLVSLATKTNDPVKSTQFK
jgi:hypothetical protein